MSKIFRILVVCLTALSLYACGPDENNESNQKSSSQKITSVTPYPTEIPKGQLPRIIRPTHYQLDLKLNPDELEFGGKVVIDLTFDVASRYMWLHGQDMAVSQAELVLEDGTKIAATYQEVDPTGIAKITFDEEVKPGKGRLSLTYRGKISEALQGIYRVNDGGVNYLYTQFEAIDARRAFPGFDEPYFKVPFDVTVTVPTGLEAISNTPETGREDLGDGFTKMTYATSKPLPAYLLAFAVGDFDIVTWADLPKTDVRDRTVPLRGIATKGKGAKLKYALENTKKILGSLEDYFQIPYPYAKLDILAVPDFAAGAMENAGAITYREQLLLLDETASLNQKKRYMGVHAHELAHQWFGNLVTPNWWDDIWLNEAFATWMGNTALDNIMPEHKFRQGLLRGAQYAMKGDSLVSARQIRQPILSNDDIMTAFDGITYSKGGGVLAMIEAFMGPEQFRAGITHYMKRHAFGNTSAEDFITAIGEKSDNVPMEQIREAFMSFLTQPGIPYLDVKTAMNDGRTQIQVSQSRYLPLGSHGDTDKSWKVPACFGYAIEGKKHKYCTLLDDKQETFILPQRGVVDYLMPNLNGSGYYRFALGAEGWSQLFGHQKALSAESMLALTDSFDAAIDAGRMDFADLVKVAPSVIMSPSYRVSTSPMGFLSFMRTYVAKVEADKEKLSALSRRLYTEKLNVIGFDARAADDGEVTNLRRSLVGHLSHTGNDRALRAKLSDMAKRYVGYSGDGKIHAEQIDKNLIDTALTVASEDLGVNFGRHLLGLYLASTDGTVRGRLLQGAASTKDAALGAEIRALALTDKMRANEVITAVYGEMFNDDLRDAAWTWFQDNFEAVKHRIPSFGQARIAGFAGDFCSLEKRDEVNTFFEPRLKEIAGGARSLAQTLESMELCAAKVKYHTPKLASFLAQ